MKKLLLFVVAVVALFAKPARADNSLSLLWDDIKSSATAHILDNATPAYFYDFKNHQQLGGVTSEIYTYRYASLDAGLVKPIDTSAKAIPVGSIDLHVGSYLAQFSEVGAVINNLGLNGGALQYVHIGGWVGKDFAAAQGNGWLYGVMGGFRIQFK